MEMPSVTVRPATAEDIAAFSDMADRPTVKAWVGVLEDRIIALGGIALNKGRWIAFLDLTDEARPFKMTMMRTAKRMMVEARRMGLRFVYAEASEPKAGAWLESLGFERVPMTERHYRWSVTGQWQN